jgi:alpha-galactosidase
VNQVSPVYPGRKIGASGIVILLLLAMITLAILSAAEGEARSRWTAAESGARSRTAAPESGVRSRSTDPDLGVSWQSSAILPGKAEFPIRIRNKSVGMNLYEEGGFQVLRFMHSGSSGEELVTDAGILSRVTLTDPGRGLNFRIVPQSLKKWIQNGPYGRCAVVSVKALSRDSVLSETIEFLIPDTIGNAIVCNVTLHNESENPIDVASWNLLSCQLDARRSGADSAFKFWSFQGGSYPERYDWIFPLTPAYARSNYQGMNAPDYGGGMPVVDLWTKNSGFALSVLSRKPLFISMPVRVLDNGIVSVSVEDSDQVAVPPHGSAELPPCVIIVHTGDFYNGLKIYSALMQAAGFSFPRAPSDAHLPEWCAWGFGRDFTKSQILETLPVVKKLGFGWVTIDDGWQNNVGDWDPDRVKFPGGEKDFETFIDSIHSYGLKVRIWWCPIAAQDSSYGAANYPDRMKEFGMGIQSRLAAGHPDWFLLDTNGRRVQVSWWNAYTLCPALPQVREYYQSFVRRAIVQWKIDGFKMDGQNLNEVPRCYNRSHNHASPMESARSVPEFFADLYNTSTRLNPSFLVQICPCGTNFSYYNLPYLNQTVASDPLDSWQVRLKGKTFRALYGRRESYSGDHVELTNRPWDPATQKFIARGTEDFASTLAVGGVPASKFTLPGVEQADSSLILDGAKFDYYQKWLRIAETEKLSEGEYLNFYDIAFDRPETHVIRKGQTYYYSFFSGEQFHGKVELRGLPKGHYRALDLLTGNTVSRVRSDSPFLNLDFDQSAIIKIVKDK